MSGPRRDHEDDVARVGGRRLAALLGVVGVACAMALLPAFVATGGVRDAVAGLAGLVAVVGAVKFAAMAWGLAAAVD